MKTYPFDDLELTDEILELIELYSGHIALRNRRVKKDLREATTIGEARKAIIRNKIALEHSATLLAQLAVELAFIIVEDKDATIRETEEIFDNMIYPK